MFEVEGERKPFFGTIVRYREDDKLWRVLYDDQDVEDYDEKELEKALKLYGQKGTSLDSKKPAPPARLL